MVNVPPECDSDAVSVRIVQCAEFNLPGYYRLSPFLSHLGQQKMADIIAVNGQAIIE
jgi:hypothetical protein